MMRKYITFFTAVFLILGYCAEVKIGHIGGDEITGYTTIVTNVVIEGYATSNDIVAVNEALESKRDLSDITYFARGNPTDKNRGVFVVNGTICEYSGTESPLYAPHWTLGENSWIVQESGVGKYTVIINFTPIGVINLSAENNYTITLSDESDKTYKIEGFSIASSLATMKDIEQSETNAVRLIAFSRRKDDLLAYGQPKAEDEKGAAVGYFIVNGEIWDYYIEDVHWKSHKGDPRFIYQKAVGVYGVVAEADDVEFRLNAENAYSANVSGGGFTFDIKGVVGKIMTFADVVGVTNNVMRDVTNFVATKEFKLLNYFVVTNQLITSFDPNSETEGDAYGGLAFDLYNTNGVYFVDEDVPTLKFFAPARRYQYFGNSITAVEIGDDRQVLRTYNLQADNKIAVRNPAAIEFMETLDRTSPYASGSAFTLQDIIDMFNPSFVGNTIMLYQTNRSDFAVGSVDVAGDIVTPNFSARAAGVVVAGDLSVSGSGTLGGALNAASVNVPSADAVTMGGVTLQAMFNEQAAQIGMVSNEVMRGIVAVEIAETPHREIRLYVDDLHIRNFQIDLKNRHTYLWDAALMDAASFERTTATWTGIKTNALVRLPAPGGTTNDVGVVADYLDTVITFDLTAVDHDLRFDIGTLNFANIGDEGGLWDLVYSDVEPDVRTVPVYREETITSYNQIYNEETGEWEDDLSSPITTTTGWYDEYSMDMTWVIPAGTCKEFRFRQAGKKAMRVDVRDIYKTVPISE